MNKELLLTFIFLNVTNVVLQTIKNLVTIKCGKVAAALMNAIAFGVYQIVLVYAVCDLPLFTKAVIVGLCNLIGVFVVKWAEEKTKKDKLWKVEITVPTKFLHEVDKIDIAPHNYIRLSSKHTLFNFYCVTKSQSNAIKNIVEKYGAKYFASESVNLF